MSYMIILLFLSNILFSPSTTSTSITYSEARAPIVIENGTKILFWKNRCPNILEGNQIQSGYYIYDIENQTEICEIETRNGINDIVYLPERNLCVGSYYLDSKLIEIDCATWSIETISKAPGEGIPYLSISSMDKICFSTSRETECYTFNYSSKTFTKIFNYSWIRNPQINHKNNCIYFSSGNTINSYNINSGSISPIIQLDGLVYTIKLLPDENNLLLTTGSGGANDAKKIFKLNLTTMKTNTFFTLPKSPRRERGIGDFEIFPRGDMLVIMSYEPYGFHEIFICNIDGSNWTKISNIGVPEPWIFGEESTKDSFFFQYPFYGLVIIYVVISIFIVVKFFRRKSKIHEGGINFYSDPPTYNQLDDIKIADCPSCSLSLFIFDKPTEKYCPECNSYFTKSDES